MITALIVLLAALLLVALSFWVRLRVLGSRLGAFPCSIETNSGWTSGMACYASDGLRWYRAISFSPLPRHVWARDTFAILGPASEIESGDGRPLGSGRSGLVGVDCRVSDVRRARPRGVRERQGAVSAVSGSAAAREVRLALPRGAYAGLASWLESAPPGGGIARTVV